jgi:uncharacterized protein
MAGMTNLPDSVRRNLAWLIFFSICASFWSRAQDSCPYGSADEAADGLVKALTRAESCSAAAAKLHACAWGSSADTEFASIVIAKCEKTFFNKLSPAGKQRYEEEMQLCAYEYARARGTLSMSEAAMCQVYVATEFSANPAKTDRPLGRASFDCGKARTTLENAICSDIHLGKADIVLSRVYADALKNDDMSDKPALIESERKWLEAIPATCGVTGKRLSPRSLNCIRIAFELRFTALDSCGDGGEKISECMKEEGEDNGGPSVAGESGAGPRASFDCESPSTGLEIVICADAELGQTDIRLAETYRKADTALGAAQHKGLVESERKWLQFVNESCPMGAIGGIPPILTRACVRQAFDTRIGQLLQCPKKAPSGQISCLNDFQLFEK